MSYANNHQTSSGAPRWTYPESQIRYSPWKDPAASTLPQWHTYRLRGAMRNPIGAQPPRVVQAVALSAQSPANSGMTDAIPCGAETSAREGMTSQSCVPDLPAEFTQYLVSPGQLVAEHGTFSAGRDHENQSTASNDDESSVATTEDSSDDILLSPEESAASARSTLDAVTVEIGMQQDGTENGDEIAEDTSAASCPSQDIEVSAQQIPVETSVSSNDIDDKEPEESEGDSGDRKVPEMPTAPLPADEIICEPRPMPDTIDTETESQGPQCSDLHVHADLVHKRFVTFSPDTKDPKPRSPRKKTKLPFLLFGGFGSTERQAKKTAKAKLVHQDPSKPAKAYPDQPNVSSGAVTDALESAEANVVLLSITQNSESDAQTGETNVRVEPESDVSRHMTAPKAAATGHTESQGGKERHALVEEDTVADTLVAGGTSLPTQAVDVVKAAVLTSDSSDVDAEMNVPLEDNRFASEAVASIESAGETLQEYVGGKTPTGVSRDTLAESSDACLGDDRKEESTKEPVDEPNKKPVDDLTERQNPWTAEDGAEDPAEESAENPASPPVEELMQEDVSKGNVLLESDIAQQTADIILTATENGVGDCSVMVGSVNESSLADIEEDAQVLDTSIDMGAFESDQDEDISGEDDSDMSTKNCLEEDQTVTIDNDHMMEVVPCSSKVCAAVAPMIDTAEPAGTISAATDHAPRMESASSTKVDRSGQDKSDPVQKDERSNIKGISELACGETVRDSDQVEACPDAQPEAEKALETVTTDRNSELLEEEFGTTAGSGDVEPVADMPEPSRASTEAQLDGNQGKETTCSPVADEAVLAKEAIEDGDEETMRTEVAGEDNDAGRPIGIDEVGEGQVQPSQPFTEGAFSRLGSASIFCGKDGGEAHKSCQEATERAKTGKHTADNNEGNSSKHHKKHKRRHSHSKSEPTRGARQGSTKSFVLDGGRDRRHERRVDEAWGNTGHRRRRPSESSHHYGHDRRRDNDGSARSHRSHRSEASQRSSRTYVMVETREQSREGDKDRPRRRRESIEVRETSGSFFGLLRRAFTA